MIDLISIVVLGAIGLFLNYKNDVLQRENDKLMDKIKWDREWAKVDKEYSIENAIASERLRAISEEFKKTCEDFSDSIRKVK